VISGEGGSGLVVTALGAVLSTEILVAFVDSVRERFGVEPVCHVLSQFVCKIAPSTYYAHRSRAPSARDLRDERICAVIEQVWHDPEGGREVAGARKMWQLLAKRGVLVEGRAVARCTIERLMRRLGLSGARREDGMYVTTRCDPAAVRAPDLVGRDFTADAPNRLWVVDFTYLETAEGRAFAAFVLDVFSRRIVGWAVADHHQTELPLAALEMALWTRAQAHQNVQGLVHHSDAGSEYTAIRYRNTVDSVGALASIGSVGDSYDNAMAESLNGIYKTECIRLEGPWISAVDIELATSSWISYYNSSRLHSSLDYRSPIEYEGAHYAGELTGSDETPADDSDQADNERHNGRDINPRNHEHAG
jgi:putative transposase